MGAAKFSRIDRVVVLSDQSSHVGGAEGIALMSAEVMADAGVPVTFITGDDASACPLDRSKIEVIALGDKAPDARSYAHEARKIYSPAAKAMVDGFITARDTPRTVYHLHNWSKIFSPSIFRALNPVSSRLFLSAHDFALVCPNLAYSNYQRDGEPCSLTPLSTACITTHCDRVSYLHKLWRVTRSLERKTFLNFSKAKPLAGIIHPDMAEYFTRGGIPADRLRVVRNPVSPFADYRIPAERNSDLFFIGRVVHEKGVDLAAEAAAMTGRRLRVIGDGDMRETLAQRYPNVTFEGWRTHAEIGALMKEARGLLVPSRLPETFTLVAHEAMRSGIPVIAFSDVDCLEASQLGAAIVVPPRSAENLAAGIRQLDDDGAVARMSELAFTESWRFSNTRQSWRDAMFVEYLALVEQDQAEQAVSAGVRGAA